MKLLVVGGGGREHAIIKKLKENIEVRTKEEMNLINDIVLMLKNILLEGKNREGESYNTVEYVHQFIQNLGSNKELKYLLGYFSKNFGYTDPNKYVFDEPMTEEGIENVINNFNIDKK